MEREANLYPWKVSSQEIIHLKFKNLKKDILAKKQFEFEPVTDEVFLSHRIYKLIPNLREVCNIIPFICIILQKKLH